MTLFELRLLEKRIDEINELVDKCDPAWDEDVLKNLENELTAITKRLKESQSKARIKELGLKLIS